jgi:hypothetical protein
VTRIHARDGAIQMDADAVETGAVLKGLAASYPQRTPRILLVIGEAGNDVYRVAG